MSIYYLVHFDKYMLKSAGILTEPYKTSTIGIGYAEWQGPCHHFGSCCRMRR